MSTKPYVKPTAELIPAEPFEFYDLCDCVDYQKGAAPMTFTPINESLTARSQGYRIDTTADFVIDHAVAERYKIDQDDPHGNRLSSEIDSFYDFFSPVYQGDDGKLYAVHMVHVDDAFLPLCWQPLVKA